MSEPNIKKPLIFGDAKQIEELKRANKNAIFCPRCNSANTFEDGNVFNKYESFCCKDCGHDWGDEHD
jgi:transposase-like protein